MWGRRVGQARGRARVARRSPARRRSPAGHGPRRDDDRRRGRRQRPRRARATTLVVRVRVTADELIDGAVAVSRDDGVRVVVRRPLQVPAGTTKELLLVAPGPRSSTRPHASTSATAIGSSPRRDLRVRIDDDVELVGVLPRLVARSRRAARRRSRWPSGTGRAELAPLPADVLDLGPLALRRTTRSSAPATTSPASTTPATHGAAAVGARRRPAAPRRRHRARRPPGAVAARRGRLRAGRARRGPHRRRGRGRRPLGRRSSSRPGRHVGPLDVRRRGVRRAASATWPRGPACACPRLVPLVILLAVYGLVIGPVALPRAAPGPPPDARLGRRPAARRRHGRRHRRRRRPLPHRAAGPADGDVRRDLAGRRPRPHQRPDVQPLGRRRGRRAPPGWLPDESTWWGVGDRHDRPCSR